MIEERVVADSIVETVRLIHPNHLNSAGRLFGGTLMEWLDEVASLVAIRHVRGGVATVSVDNMKFMHGADLKNIIVMVGRMTFVGNTSMEVRVDTYAESVDEPRRLINQAYFNMVSVDERGKPRKVPPLMIETKEEQAEWKAAQKRREMRIKRKQEGF